MNKPTDVIESEAILPQPVEGYEPEAGDTGRETFRANGLDMTALGALASGALVLLSCLTCGQALNCLPLLPFVLGIIGLATAKRAVDPKRTRLWSWLGIGSGAVTMLFIAIAIAGYVSFVLFLVLVSEGH
ncbi:MAG: hypothetical protein JXC32_04360 [Anaerolineae bacterium]|nr:hypothetical protein [Anaerolineae bacterium]